jgi:type IV secretion system protein VirD4
MADVLRWVNTQAETEVRAALGTEDGVVADDDDAAACRAALEVLESVWRAEERLRSSLQATVAGAIDAYGDREVLACSREVEITADWLLSGSNTLYLCAPADEQERLAPLFVALIGEIRAEVYRRAAASGRAVDPALLLVLDEAANVAPVPDLDVLASTGAGQGLQLVTVVQDLAQVHRRWRAAAETVVNNHTAKVLGAGIACPRTLEYFGRLLGDQELRQVSTSTQDGGYGHRSRTESSTWRALAPANVLRESEAGTGLLVYRNLPPARLELRPWFWEPQLRELAGRPAVGAEVA